MEKDSANYHLLQNRSSSDDEEYVSPVERGGVRTYLKQNYLWGITIVLLLYLSVLVTVDLVLNVRHATETLNIYDKDLTHGIVKYEMRHEWDSEPVAPWDKQPSDELDFLWYDILKAKTIRVSPAEMEMLGENTTNRVRTKEGDYAGVIGVYHHLHCLENIRRLVHWDYYGPRATETQLNAGIFEKEHFDHCLNALRQSLMCHANTAFYSTEWTGNTTQKPNKELRTNSKSRCVNWESLDTWARTKALIPGTYKYQPGPFEIRPEGV